MSVFFFLHIIIFILYLSPNLLNTYYRQYFALVLRRGIIIVLEITMADNHHGVVTHLEPDILECEAKWALGSITMNKASGGDEIPVELFQILKDDTVKVLHSICQQIWKTQQWLQDWKGQFSF